MAGGLVSAGLGGFSTGYESANPGMGALGGGLQGLGAGMQLASVFPAMATALPVIGVAVGAVAGILAGPFGFKRKKNDSDQCIFESRQGDNDDRRRFVQPGRRDRRFWSESASSPDDGLR